MSNTKAIIDFSSYTAAELGPIAQHIHDQMTANAAEFDAPPVAMTALQTLVTNYTEKLADRASNATVDVLAAKEARDELEEALATLGQYVNGRAKGDAMMVEHSGFPSYTTGAVADNSPPAAPTDLRLRQGALSGSLVARYKPQRRASTNEVQVTTGDPNVESAWQTRGIFKSGRAELDGFTPGTVVWVRVRTVGLKGVMGSWSDPAQIRLI
ncbi:MAG: hypothetical protein KDM63_10035 [Verrucomicrobiae bacterium]|nr:hypothetical protein [Verrucomicrobiae bacterium]